MISPLLMRLQKSAQMVDLDEFGLAADALYTSLSSSEHWTGGYLFGRNDGLWQDIATGDASLTRDLSVQQQKKCHAGQPFVLNDDPNDNELVNGEAVTARWETRIDKRKGYVDGNVREARRAASIDVWKFMHDMWNPKGWPALDAEFVEKTRLPSEEKAIIDAWKVAFPGEPFVHFEALITMEHIILHELFHTKHGGRNIARQGPRQHRLLRLLVHGEDPRGGKRRIKVLDDFRIAQAG
ncbi:hypothetical protein CSOJ01_03829 [Colletotrichum sojae]|uniref:Uncharacterized protein n=1 Tax=Colletotrichum sojae TaxID=2175907 RepID=A0A8H6N0A0_9PEZI|nr:hypothetical protein CSOJ01_03829 [Colletotrichum sojae]